MQEPFTGTTLRQMRLLLGLTQAALARRLGVPYDTLNRWEHGRMAIGHPQILRLAMLALIYENLGPPQREIRAG